jgi:hypothetical protein
MRAWLVNQLVRPVSRSDQQFLLRRGRDAYRFIRRAEVVVRIAQSGTEFFVDGGGRQA